MERHLSEADSPDPPTPAVPCKRRRWRRWIALVLSLVLVGGFARFAYLRITLRPTPRPAYWEEKLAALDPPPPGAISSRAAFDILNNRPWESDPQLKETLKSGVLSVLRGPWDESREDIEAVTKVFASEEFKTARGKLRDAAEAGWRDEINLSPEFFSYGPYSLYPAWGKWLTVHSRWVVERNGDVETGVQDWLLCLRMTRQLVRTRLVIAQLVGIAADMLLATEMMRAAWVLPAPIDSRALASDIDDIIGPALSPRDFLAGELAYTMCVLEHLYVRDGGNWLDVSEAAALTSTFRRMGAGAAPSRIWNITSPLFHDVTTARECLREATAAIDDLDTIAAAEAARDALPMVGLGTLDGFQTMYSGRLRLSPAHVAPMLSQYYQQRCQLDAALTLLALQEYRRRHDEYPESLDELVPDFLPRPPIDYADRRPLRYRLTDDGFVLYSIGRDGKDNGGRCANPKWPWDPQNADAVFSEMRRPEPYK